MRGLVAHVRRALFVTSSQATLERVSQPSWRRISSARPATTLTTRNAPICLMKSTASNSHGESLGTSAAVSLMSAMFIADVPVLQMHRSGGLALESSWRWRCMEHSRVANGISEQEPNQRLADVACSSVLKKRKLKMNKHKHRKRRKQNRHKTRP